MPDERSGEGVGRGEISPADKASFERRIGELDKQLGEARSLQEASESQRDRAVRARGMAYGLRMASELVGAVLVGGLIGYGLDQWLGSWPWLFLLFFVLGFAAGVLNVIRGFTRLQAEIKEATRGDIGHAVPDDEDD
jgi:ATP synthase protein I